MEGTIAVAGALAQRPGYGGHAWVFLQYLLGFRRLGWDVLFLDRLVEGSMPGHVTQIMDRFDLADSYCVLGVDGESVAGLSRRQALDRMREAILINVMGYLDDDDFREAARLRVFLDIDPGFPQMWRELGLADPFAGHDVHVTIGENIGRPDCSIPTCGLDWITTRQPIVLEEWPAQASSGGSFTSIGSWRGPYGPIDFHGVTYGLRVHEFRRFVELPRLTGQTFELALDIDPAESADLELLAANGWHLVDPRRAVGDPLEYRQYIQASKAELMIAKGMYVQSRSGWFSDRSTCFLASGRPVLAQDTGLVDLYPTDGGLLVFSTPAEALARVEEILGDYDRLAQAARALAEDRFDSNMVLTTLIARITGARSA